MITKNFSWDELRCKCGCATMKIPHAEIHRLQELRDTMGHALKINSAYRCPKHNAKVSSTGENGPHTKGAFDIGVAGDEALRLIAAARKVGFTGIGVSQKGPHGRRFIHVDALPNEPGQPRPWLWSY